MTENENTQENLDEQIQAKKEELKELLKEKEKYTFKGLYSQIAGRKNILRELQDNDTLKDEEKYTKAKQIIKNFAKAL